MVYGILIGALLILFIILSVVTVRKGKQRKAEQKAQEAAEKPEQIDPNYHSILGEDAEEGDPFDRSYGVSPEDDAADE